MKSMKSMKTNSYKLFEHEIVIREILDGNKSGLGTWPISICACEYFYTHPLSCTSRILEIGSGAGLLGILMRKMGSSIYLSDYDHDVLSNLHNNLLLNKLGTENVHLLDWKEKNKMHIGTFDCVIGVDVLYSYAQTPIEECDIFDGIIFKHNQEDVLHVLEQYLLPDGVAHLFVNEGRSSIKKFLRKAEQSFQVKKREIKLPPSGSQQCSFHGQIFSPIHVQLRKLRAISAN